MLAKLPAKRIIVVDQEASKCLLNVFEKLLDSTYRLSN